jgi:uncharacterized protein YdaU (DUF1376 family)
MKPDCYMAFDWPKFQSATAGWSRQHKWSYFNAICAYYWTDCIGLEDENEFLMHVCECFSPADWGVTKQRIFSNGYFELIEGRWHQKRAKEEYIRAKTMIEKKSAQTLAARKARGIVTSDVTSPVTETTTPTPTPTPVPTPSPTELLKREPSALPPVPFQEILKVWNSNGPVQCLIISDKRRQLMEVRWRNKFFRDNWERAVEIICKSDFCCGQNERGWKASFDWFLQPDTVAKAIEGKYTRTKKLAQPVRIAV